MPIDLGLSRVLRLLKCMNDPQRCYKSIHVAGTNGKGSTLAYLLLILTRANIRNGKFTSPHMIYYNDCILINDEMYPLAKYEHISLLVEEKNRCFDIGCTEFELLTVTAFKIFEEEKVEVALIEVGLGGRLDATNVLPAAVHGQHGVVATGITKIAQDHENLLGSTLTAIAKEKAGILKSAVPCVVDGTNAAEVLAVVKVRAKECHSSLDIITAVSEPAATLISNSPLVGKYQLQNLGVALGLLHALKLLVSFDDIVAGIKSTKWPGRLQWVEFKGLSVLLDGAHNENAAVELGKYLESKIRPQGIIFVVGMTGGKLVCKLLKHVARHDVDTVIPVGFSQPDKMPWIHCYAPEELARYASKYVKHVDRTCGESVTLVLERLQWRKQEGGDDRPVVVCGSLYLAGELLRAIL